MTVELLTPCLDRIIQATTEGPDGLALARTAHAEFVRLAGEFEDSDACFEERTQAFLDWFVFDRRGPGGRTPAEEVHAARSSTFGPAEAPVHAALCRSMRGLFRIESIGSRLGLRELCGGAAFLVVPIGDVAGLTVADVIDGHVVPLGGQVVLTRGMVFHPREAAEAIEGLVPRALAAGETRETVLFALLRMRMRFDRYRGIKAGKIYRYPFAGFP